MIFAEVSSSDPTEFENNGTSTCEKLHLQFGRIIPKSFLKLKGLPTTDVQHIFPVAVARLIAHKSVADFGCLGISPVVLGDGGGWWAWWMARGDLEV